jgi:signal transduction histidine kinase
MEHELTINFVSAVITLLFALMILLLYRSVRILREKKWVLPFAGAFLVISLLYFVRIYKYVYFKDVTLKPNHYTNVINFLGSGLSNYLLLLSGFRLLGAALHERLLLQLRKWRIKRSYFEIGLLLFLCSASLLSVYGGAWAELPDAILSMLALVFMGYMLFQNISYRRDKVMAWIALLSSLGYAVLYLLRRTWGMDSIATIILPDGSSGEVDTVGKVLFYLVSLVPKFGLFLPGYSLMLILSAPFEGIERLLKIVTKGEKELIESDGVVKSIRDEHHFKNARLHIKLPGSEDNEVALYTYPLPRDGSNLGLRIDKYEEGTDYDRVMKSGVSYIRDRNGYVDMVMRRITEATVPVYFHQSVIACLSAERGEGKFTEVDLGDLERIATMLSPSVQAYREVAAINKLYQNLSQLQIEVEEYNLEQDVRGIIEKFHDVIKPTATGVSIETGFLEYHFVYPPGGELKGPVEERLKAELGDGDVTEQQGGRRWLTIGLRVPDKVEAGRKIDKPVFGKLIFAAERRKRGREQVAVGTNPAFRRALSDLMTDTLLDFVRGYLNYRTDILGVQLSRLEGMELDKWHKVVDDNAQKVGLVWVVARVPQSHTLFGETETIKLVNELESPEWLEKWEEKGNDLWLTSLGERREGAWRVVRKFHADSGATLWFGVARQKFEAELDYISPWKYFLDHFCEISNSALLRIQIMIGEAKRINKLAVLNSLMSKPAGDYAIFHNLRNDMMALTNKLSILAKDVRDAMPQRDGRYDQMIQSLEGELSRTKDDILRLRSDVQRNNNRPCSLTEAITEVCQGAQKTLAGYPIDINIEILAEASVDVPFHIAKHVLQTIIDNAVDALKEVIDNDRGGSGRINIRVCPTPTKVICDITDDGPGVPDLVLPVLFKDHIRSDKANSGGLGLYLSRAWLISYQGDIMHVDQNPSSKLGATFRIKFPKA